MSFWNRKKTNEEAKSTEPTLVWEKVQSSFVEAVAYDENNDDLYVTLSHGSYVYHGIPRAIFDSFLDAPSKGSFFNGKIKDTYTFSPR